MKRAKKVTSQSPPPSLEITPKALANFGPRFEHSEVRKRGKPLFLTCYFLRAFIDTRKRL